MPTTLDRLRAVIAERLGIPQDRVAEDKSFDELGADSLDSIDVMMAVEEEFGIEIGDEEAERVNTVGELARLVEGKARAQ